MLISMINTNATKMITSENNSFIRKIYSINEKYLEKVINLGNVEGNKSDRDLLTIYNYQLYKLKYIGAILQAESEIVSINFLTNNNYFFEMVESYSQNKKLEYVNYFSRFAKKLSLTKHDSVKKLGYLNKYCSKYLYEYNENYDNSTRNFLYLMANMLRNECLHNSTDNLKKLKLYNNIYKIKE